MVSGVRDRIPETTAKKKQPPYVVDDARLERFSSKNTIFNRIQNDPTWKGYNRMFDEHTQELVKQGKKGYSRVDFALAEASDTVYDAFEGGISHVKIKLYRTPSGTMGIDWTKNKQEVESPAEMSRIVKRAAKLCGASLVGVCKLNRRWLYAEADVPETLENAIVMGIEMDAKAIGTSPAAPASAATGVGYSKMAFILALLGEFIRNLGYTAWQCGNDTALSIPLAVDSGLGELGRNGLLITPQYGPRVRLCKILTDLPLAADNPISFGVKEFCRKCKACADKCESGAISSSDNPSFNVACKSNSPGALKWYVNVERCYEFWCQNGIDCSTCITVCPCNKKRSPKPK
jgi:epoxyqueuosine reductase